MASSSQQLPGWVNLASRLIIWLQARGLSFLSFHVLAIPDRRSGKLLKTVVSPFTVDGRRYILSSGQLQWGGAQCTRRWVGKSLAVGESMRKVALVEIKPPESRSRLPYPRVDLTIATGQMDSAEAQRLIAGLDAGLAELYTPDQRFGPNLKPAQLGDGRGVFLIARDAGRAVACGAIRLLDDVTAEVKRMYVEPELRGRGVGRAVLDALEERARAMGVRRLVLETGIHQHAAIALYTRAGFRPTDCWGDYLTATTSVCFEKNV